MLRKSFHSSHKGYTFVVPYMQMDCKRVYTVFPEDPLNILFDCESTELTTEDCCLIFLSGYQE